jgi:hypothetical protein
MQSVATPVSIAFAAAVALAIAVAASVAIAVPTSPKAHIPIPHQRAGTLVADARYHNSAFDERSLFVFLIIV